ncbi:MAG TPA: glycosyltransferase family 39 protein [Thermoanaerobaculia bacterium]|nr:glycosyltransferase family 39 protein [Thermoanaerobaculia bacterium]
MSTRLLAAVHRLSPTALVGFVLVAAVRALTLPRSLWEMDEFLFSGAIGRFAPLQHRPHPPGYPLTVGLGKLFALVFPSHFVSLVALAVVSSLVGYWALFVAFRRIAGGPGAERVAVAGALLFQLSPVMLVQGTLPMSDPPALMFIALALAAAAILHDGGGTWAAAGLGAAASAAIGCRPQLALIVLPMLVVALWRASWSRRGEALISFTLVSIVWFAPLMTATGGPSGLLAYEMKQAAYVALHDATASRGTSSRLELLTRFLAHPWGTKWLSMPVLLLAVAGTVALVRRRRTAALPLAVLSAVQLAVCLLMMDPADGVRYALPTVLCVAFAAVVGSDAAARRLRLPAAAAWVIPGLVLVGGALYARPLLAARATTVSPPLQAALWAHRHLPAGAGILVQDDLAPHAHFLLRGFDLSPVDAGLQSFARRPYAPLWLYAEGESTWPGAVTFRWPESDAYGKLTRNHYRIVSLSPIPADARYQIVRGVNAFEPSVQDARWRWLDSDAVLRIFPLDIRAVAVTLGLPAVAPLASNTVIVSVNGKSIKTVELPRGTESRFELPVESEGRTEIAFHSSHSFGPGGPNSRRLAVQLRGLKRLPR